MTTNTELAMQSSDPRIRETARLFEQMEQFFLSFQSVWESLPEARKSEIRRKNTKHTRRYFQKIETRKRRETSNATARQSRMRRM